MMGDAGRDVVLASFHKQIGWCEALGSPLTARVLAILAESIAAAEEATAFIVPWPGDPVADALPLRLAGALHALVLTGACPALAACYPPHGSAGLDQAVQGALLDHGRFIRAFITSPPQTNEVGRSAVLLGGFLHIAASTGLPMRLLEIGASAGLNLVWDQYRYRLGTLEWGDPSSPLLLAPAWDGPSPTPGASVRVLERRGCDIAPIDVHDPQQRLRLRAYVWADQPDRLTRLEHALQVAEAAGYGVERADAAEWVAARLSTPAPGCSTVLYHSIMWQYMPEATRTAIERTLHQAGAAATPDAPLAWLRFEPSQPDARPELSVTLWPGGTHTVLAQASAHGTAVTWAGSRAGP